MKAKYLPGIILLLIIVSWVPLNTVSANPEFAAPDGFYPILADNGVDMYRKDYPGGTPDFVQVVSMNHGGGLQLLHGEVSELRNGQGSFGGNDARISAKPLRQFWNEVNSAGSGAFCVLNGQFFKMGEAPTRLPFALKVNGQIISDGYGHHEFPGQTLMLEVWADRVDIKALSKETLYASSAPNIVAGLTEDARKSPQKYVARTFVGVDDRNGDGTYETALIFNTQSARQKDAAGVLRDFGADKVMMLDGGGSTQLICKDEFYIKSDRQIPQAIAVLSGNEIAMPNENGLAKNLLTFNFIANPDLTSGEAAQAGIVITDSVFVLFGLLPVVLILVFTISRIQPRNEY